MYRRPEISVPILLEQEIKPLSLRNKDRPLPPLPTSLPHSARIHALEQENEVLRKEVRSLRSQLAMSIHRVRRYRRLFNATKSFIRSVQNATFEVKEIERAVEQEWSTYQGKLENHMIVNETLENKI